MWYNVAWEIVTRIREYLNFKSKEMVKVENNGVVVKIKVREKLLLENCKDFYWDLYFSLTLAQIQDCFNEKCKWHIWSYCQRAGISYLENYITLK